MDELLLIKEKVTEEHKLVDEWTGRYICKLFSNISKTTNVSRQVNRFTDEQVYGWTRCRLEDKNNKTEHVKILPKYGVIS